MTARGMVPAGARVEYEQKMGVESIEALLDDRAELVAKVAPLRALYSSFGTWDHRRKIELSRLKGEIRATLLQQGKKVSNDQLDDMAHADPRYEQFVIEATKQRAEWAILENRIQAVNDVILRDNAIARFSSAEAHLR